MTKAKGIKNKVAGKAKQIAGEIVGDQQLQDEGQAQERKGDKETEESGGVKPFGNLDQLTRSAT
jgi:uncharacterized protein YjbJ (UPF0337 family)